MTRPSEILQAGGSRVAVLAGPSPLLSWLRVGVRSGASYESEEFQGMAFLAGRLFTSSARDQDELAQWGATMNVTVGRQVTLLDASCLSGDEERVLNCLSRRLNAPFVAGKNWEKIMELASTAADTRETDSGWIANQLFRRALYGEGHALARPIEPLKTSLPGISPIACDQFLRSTWSREGLVVVAAGSWNPDLLVNVCERFPGSSHIAKCNVAGKRDKAECRMESARFHTAAFVLGGLGPGRRSVDYWGALVANAMLYETAVKGRIGRTLRSSGLAYHISSQFGGNESDHPWAVRVRTNLQDLESAICAVRADIQSIRTQRPSKDELRRTKRWLATAAQESRSPPSAVAQWNAALVSGLGDFDPEGDMSCINAVTAADVLDSVNRYLREDQVVLGTAAPTNRNPIRRGESQ